MKTIIDLVTSVHFVYHQTMSVELADAAIARVAGAIAEPARARMLCNLMDGRARTSTELGVIAEVGPSTASVHLARLKQLELVKVVAQGKHRYYSLADERVAATLESLMVLAGTRAKSFVPNTPAHLRWARTCYDHMAGEVAVALHDRLLKNKWITRTSRDNGAYELTALATRELTAHGIDVPSMLSGRRRIACACLDWSERRPHVGGAVGAAILRSALQHKWVLKDLDSRVLRVTKRGEREFLGRFGGVQARS
ncbi:MAG TPA: helix-turn-helix transcriptional regulator [Steroidobacteraceae bacterium]|nr:helix-turn-helix transcriptional regulator [Steroidobacteraceae bacterium]